MIDSQERTTMPEHEPIFISFVEDHVLDTDVAELKRMKGAHGCIIAFNKERNILGIGFHYYNHILEGDEIFLGREKKKPKAKETYTYEEILRNLNIHPKDINEEHMSLKEIKAALIDDPELTNAERFELYYKHYQREKEKTK